MRRNRNGRKEVKREGRKGSLGRKKKIGSLEEKKGDEGKKERREEK